MIVFFKDDLNESNLRPGVEALRLQQDMMSQVYKRCFIYAVKTGNRDNKYDIIQNIHLDYEGCSF